jgi:peroxin-6
MLYLGLNSTHEMQLQLLQALTRKFQLEPELDLSLIAQQCAFNFTGADFYAMCSDAMLRAMKRKTEEIDVAVCMCLSPLSMTSADLLKHPT